MALSKKHLHFVSSFLSILLVLVVFSSPLGPLPPLGDFLDPTGGGIFEIGFTAEYPEYEEVIIPADLLKGNVTVLRDPLGIPHIYSDFDSDAYFAIGYVQAQDRLFQLDIQRRLFSGTLSEVLGNSTLENDILFRSIGLMREANILWNILKTETEIESVKLVESLIAYSNGINQYIDENHPIPFEFQLLNYVPTHWEPQDSIGLAKYMSFSLGFEDYDLKFAEIVDGLGIDKAYELFPEVAPLQIPVVPTYGGYPMPDKYSFTEAGSNSSAVMPPLREKVNYSPELLKDIKSVSKVLEETFTSFGFLLDGFKGSNSWAISGNRTETGSPIVGNDMHLQWSVPSIWYQLSYHSNESNLNVWGFSFVGSPSIVAGHNSYVAWGFTNVGGDVLDWYYYTEKNNQYFHDGEFKDFDSIDEIIAVKGKENYTHTVKTTVHGPVIPGKSTLDGKKLVASWVGIKDYKTDLDRKFAFKAVYGFHLAKNYEEFKAAVYKWDGPAQNIIFADKNNIALWVAGIHPIRPAGIDGRLPVNGSDNNDWLGYVSAEDWPHTVNPEQGYIVSANQRSVGPDYEYYIGSLQADGYRARRINFMLHSDSSVSIDDMKTYQTDILDTSAEAFVPWLLEAASNNLEFGNNVINWDSAISALKNWDYIMDKDKKEPLIFKFFFDNYLKFTFADEWESNGIENEQYVQNVFLENLTWLDPNSIWFDNISTIDVVESSEDILLISLEEALITLSNETEFGSYSELTYGSWHKGYFEHLTFLKALSSTKDSISGSGYTVNPSRGEISKGGASERAIYDLSDLQNSLSALPGGQSGNPVSKHYLDLLYTYFLEWDYYSQYFYVNIEDFPTDIIESTLILRRAS